MKISIVVAMAMNKVIGSKNSLPWHIPEDLKKLKELTTGHALIMGRKTFESLPIVLPGREHYVVTRMADFKDKDEKARGNEHVFIVSDPVGGLEIINERITFVKDIPEEVFVFGGAEIFTQLLPYSDKMYITFVKKDFEGDTFFPEIDYCEWNETERQIYDGFDFVVYERAAE